MLNEIIVPEGLPRVRRYPWHKLAQIGDGLIISGRNLLNVQQCAHRYANARGWEIMTRIIDNKIEIVRTGTKQWVKSIGKKARAKLKIQEPLENSQPN